MCSLKAHQTGWRLCLTPLPSPHLCAVRFRTRADAYFTEATGETVFSAVPNCVDYRWSGNDTSFPLTTSLLSVCTTPTNHQDGRSHIWVKAVGTDGRLDTLKFHRRSDDPGDMGKLHNDITFTPITTERGGWGHKLDFLFSCISLSVGLGNVWRFPYLCYKNGGGAFLVTYTIAMFLLGIPLFFQEVAVGQYLGVGGSTFVGQLCPIFQGVGYATMTMVFFLDLYYCVIIAWGIFYLVSSVMWFPGLPWSSCGNWWNSQSCYEEGINVTVAEGLVKHGRTAIEEFWERRVLKQSDGITDVGGLQWELLIALFFGWVIVYSVVCRGLHQSGKVIWFTAIFPYAVLLVLLVRSVTLPGAVDGLWYYITPRWEELLRPGTWIDGATQIFFAYSIGTGALPALGSYNSFNHNCYKDAVITCVVNTFTSLLAGVCTFAVLGNIALEQNTSVGSVVNSGPGLVFLTYPEVVLKLPGATIWAVIFFLMLIILGIDSEFCLVESFVTGMVDKWPKTLLPHRQKFTLAVCCFLFILGIPMVTHGGIYLFQLMDYYSASGLSLLWVCFFQTIAISWFFGADRISEFIDEMMGIKVSRFWHICWVYLSPAVMIAIFIFNLVQYVPATYGSYNYPVWAQNVGIMISLSSMLWIPGYAIYHLLSTPGTFQQRLKIGCTPKANLRHSEVPESPASKMLPTTESSAVLIT